MADYRQYYSQYGQQYGLPNGALDAIAHLESRGNPNAQNPVSSAGGLFQFTDATARGYGLSGDARFDPARATEAAAKLARDNYDYLSRTLGREPSVGEIYLAHQQGMGGAAALLRNPNQSALSALTKVYGNEARARAAIKQNGGSVNMTAGQFAGIWTNKANRALAQIQPQGPAVPSSQVNASIARGKGAAQSVPALQKSLTSYATAKGNRVTPQGLSLMAGTRRALGSAAGNSTLQAALDARALTERNRVTPQTPSLMMATQRTLNGAQAPANLQAALNSKVGQTRVAGQAPWGSSVMDNYSYGKQTQTRLPANAPGVGTMMSPSVVATLEQGAPPMSLVAEQKMGPSKVAPIPAPLSQRPAPGMAVAAALSPGPKIAPVPAPLSQRPGVMPIGIGGPEFQLPGQVAGPNLPKTLVGSASKSALGIGAQPQTLVRQSPLQGRMPLNQMLATPGIDPNRIARQMAFQQAAGSASSLSEQAGGSAHDDAQAAAIAARAQKQQAEQQALRDAFLQKHGQTWI